MADRTPDTPASFIHIRRPMGDADYERLRRRWEKKYADAGRAHRVQVMERDRSGGIRRWRPPFRNRIIRRIGRVRLGVELAVWRMRRAGRSRRG